MALSSTKYVVKFDHPITVELHPKKRLADCSVYFNSNGVIVGSEILLKHPYTGKKYTLCTMEDESSVLARAKILYESQKQTINIDVNTINDDEATREIRKKDLIASNSFSRVREPRKRSKSVTESEALEPDPAKQESNKQDLFNEVKLLIIMNNNSITVQEICDRLDISESTVQNYCKKLNVNRIRDDAYKGKGRRFLLSIGNQEEYLPQKA